MASDIVNIVPSVEETWNISGRSVIFRELQLDEDFGQSIALTMAEGWACTIGELKMQLKTHSKAFWGLFEEDGTLICQVFFTKVSETLACLSQYVTSKPYRGQGFGSRLFRRVLDLNMSDGLVAILDAVNGMTPVYNKSGFTSSGVKILRYQVDPNVTSLTMERDPKADDTLTVQRLMPSMIDALCEYDMSICGYDRRAYLSAILRAPQMIALSAKDPGGVICGYVILFHHLPLSTKDKPIYRGLAFYAESKSVATRLLLEARQSYLPSEASFFFFSTLGNEACFEVFSQFGDVRCNLYDSMDRMTLGGHLPNFPLEKIYGVLSLENEVV